ncbi:MAG: hypothetical protein ABIT10_12935 [Alteraurantiacibacter sp.]
MVKALNHTAGHTRPSTAAKLDWRKRMSNHVAWSLLVYTAIQIVANAIMLKHGGSASVLPYFALVLLVIAVIPAWRLLESRWTDLSDAQACDPALAGAFARDRALIWLAALGLPLLLTGFFKLVEVMQA